METDAFHLMMEMNIIMGHRDRDLHCMLQRNYEKCYSSFSCFETFFDVPCGDWLWMQTVNLTGVQYFGGDITNITIQKNRQCFEEITYTFTGSILLA